MSTVVKWEVIVCPTTFQPLLACRAKGQHLTLDYAEATMIATFDDFEMTWFFVGKGIDMEDAVAVVKGLKEYRERVSTNESK